MADDYLEKFRLTAEHKQKMKEAFNEIIEKQFEALEGTYLDLFRSLPKETAESMSVQDAARFVDMVVNEAANGIVRGANMLRDRVNDLSKDEEKMNALRKSFLDSLGYKEEENGR